MKIGNKATHGFGRWRIAFGAVALSGLVAPAFAPAFASAPVPAAAPAPDAAHLQWQEAIAHTPTPQEGCFKAAFPSNAWSQVVCAKAPNKPYVPARGRHGYTVGDGNDYSAVVTGRIASAVGSFPTVTGLTSETGYGGHANTYSLQLNSQFFKTSACDGGSTSSSCLGWQQFVYTNSGAAFMQYWLINYGSSCPSGGWMAYSGSCYRNSAAVSLPPQAATQLANLKVTGSAVAGGTDTMVMTTASNAYSTTGKDNVVLLATAWNAGEFNVVGDGGGSAAKFNKGTSMTVQIAIHDGLTAAPSCQSEDGTTGETNNLTLGACTVSGGSVPTVQFSQRR